jgi:hypothetical protein
MEYATVTWRVHINNQVQEVEMPSNFGHTEVKNDLVENCGFPENIRIQRIG